MFQNHLTKVYLVFLITILSLTPKQVLADKITGAFGFNFGDVMTREKLSKMTLDKNGKSYFMSASNEFIHHKVIAITTSSRKIFQISGTRFYHSSFPSNACMTELLKVKNLLLQKYDLINPFPFLPAQKNSYYYKELPKKEKTKTILLYCAPTPTGKGLTITYTDSVLTELNKEEAKGRYIKKHKKEPNTSKF
jgi:hypothetical protein